MEGLSTLKLGLEITAGFLAFFVVVFGLFITILSKKKGH